MSAHSKTWVVLILLAAATLGSIWLVAPWLYVIGITLLAASVLGMLGHKAWALTTTTILTSLTLFESVFVALPDPDSEFNLLQSISGHSASTVGLYLFVAFMVAPWLTCLWVINSISQRKSV